MTVRCVHRLPPGSCCQAATMAMVTGVPWEPKPGRRVRIAPPQKSDIVVSPAPLASKAGLECDDVPSAPSLAKEGLEKREDTEALEVKVFMQARNCPSWHRPQTMRWLRWRTSRSATVRALRHRTMQKWKMSQWAHQQTPEVQVGVLHCNRCQTSLPCQVDWGRLRAASNVSFKSGRRQARKKHARQSKAGVKRGKRNGSARCR